MWHPVAMELYYPLLSTVPQLQASDIAALGQEYSQALDRPSDKEISKKKMLVRLQSHRMLPYTTKKMNFTYCRIFSFWGVGGRGGVYFELFAWYPQFAFFKNLYNWLYEGIQPVTIWDYDECGWMWMDEGRVKVERKFHIKNSQIPHHKSPEHHQRHKIPTFFVCWLHFIW